MKKSYTQAFKSNILQKIENVLQLKKAFPSLLVDKVEKILKAKNSGKGIKKPRINMTMKELLRRKIIVPTTKSNIESIVNLAHIYITNINKYLKNSKSDIIADFIHINNNRIVITTNKPTGNLDLSTIKKFLKNINNVNPDSIKSSCLLKFKLYMKIVGLPHKLNQKVITPDFIKDVLKESHLFKDIILASKPCIIKTSPKSDIAVVWIDIWDSQNGFLTKNIINCFFNIGWFIVTIRGMNMNLGIP